jgi:ACS family hexuronate transporter-like MFS transporter
VPKPTQPELQPSAVSATVPKVIGQYRWFICALLFFATTINYIDRQILSLLKEILDQRIGWTNTQFGLANSTFQFAYGIGLLGFGWLVDRFGTKLDTRSLLPGGPWRPQPTRWQAVSAAL